MVAIASSAGISLENAQLFERQNRMIEEQKIIFDSFIETLASSIDARDKITSGHSTRVKMYSALIADEFGMEKGDKYILEKAAALHDIGKIGIRDSVLQKEGKLTAEEYKHIQEHVGITQNILEKIHMSKDFQQITDIAVHISVAGFGLSFLITFIFAYKKNYVKKEKLKKLAPLLIGCIIIMLICFIPLI